MKIVVIGGTGLIGSKLVAILREHAQEVVAASPCSGVNSITREGLADVLKGAAVVVDVTNSPSWEDAAVLQFFETSTHNLLDHETAAGVRHHVALSVVGTERMLESGFFRAKLAQENLIETASIPYSIVRATQFFEFVSKIADLSTNGNQVRLPPVLLQPMAANDVVAARNDPREVIADPNARYYGIAISEKTLIPDSGARLGKIQLEAWLKQAWLKQSAKAPTTTSGRAA
jgi:uncharacterized protein YbjT (DUF2867 family)